MSRKGEKVDYIVAVCGDSAVGKSSITIQYVKSTFIDYHDPTVEDSYIKKTTLGDRTFLLEILDTAGQEDFKVLRDIFVRKSDLFILVFDLTNNESIKFVEQIYQKIVQTKEGSVYGIVLVGNKADLERGKNGVSLEEGQKLAKQFEAISYFETSAKTRTNVSEAFEAGILSLASRSGNKKKKSPTGCILC